MNIFSFLQKRKNGETDGRKYKNQKIYRNHDLPAVVTCRETWWYNKEGKLHRIGCPAIISPNGIKNWYFNGCQKNRQRSLWTKSGELRCIFPCTILSCGWKDFKIKGKIYTGWYTPVTECVCSIQ